jgi:hypothetical protein
LKELYLLLIIEGLNMNLKKNNQPLTIPSLQGTLAKPTKPILLPNFAKEPFRPSRSSDGLRDSTNLINKQIENKNRQCLTAGIVHAGFSGLLLFVARKKSWCTLIGNLLVIPHDTIPANRYLPYSSAKII